MPTCGRHRLLTPSPGPHVLSGALDGLFAGVGVALVSLFNDDLSLDAPACASLAARLVELGVQGVVVAGSTGEAAALEASERIQLLRAVRDAVPSVAVVAGTGAPTARQAVAFTHDACDAGADAVLALSPPGSSDVRPYYDEVAKAAGDVPVLAYHFSAMSAPGFPVDVLAELPVAGCKDSSGEPGRLLEELDVFDGALYTGSSAMLAFAGPVGCRGAILSLANSDPEGCIAAFGGDVAAQRGLVPARRIEAQNFPAGVKELTAARFGTSTVIRVG